MKLEWDFSELYEFADNLENISRFEEVAERITKDISKALLKRIKGFTPVDGYDLINGWDKTKIIVTEVNGGFEVLLTNPVEYALYVNDGHRAFNQYGGAYPIKKRVQVRSAYPWQKGDATYYVFGHFFVERGIISLTESKEIESIIYRELQKWWDSI